MVTFDLHSPCCLKKCLIFYSIFREVFPSGVAHLLHFCSQIHKVPESPLPAFRCIRSHFKKSSLSDLYLHNVGNMEMCLYTVNWMCCIFVPYWTTKQKEKPVWQSCPCFVVLDGFRKPVQTFIILLPPKR